MNNDRREFYNKVSNRETKDIKITRTCRNNRFTKNGMIRFDNNQNITLKSKFIFQSIICVFIVLSFFYLLNSKSDLSKEILEKTKIIITKNLNIRIIENKVDEIFSKFSFDTNIVNGGEKDNSIDDDLIKKMEDEINNSKKK